MKKLSKPLKLLIGIILLPTAFFVFLAIGSILWALVRSYDKTMFFLFGIVIYILVHKFIYGFTRLYVFAHEAVHALAALLCGYKVKSMTVGADDGNVKLSGCNTFVLLAPYIFPLFSFCTVLLYFILNLFISGIDKRIFIFLLGIFTAHHLIHTYKALTEAWQSDIKLAGGSIFSFSFITLANAAFIILFLQLFFPGVVPVTGVVKDIVSNTVIFWRGAASYFYRIILWIFGN